MAVFRRPPLVASLQIHVASKSTSNGRPPPDSTGSIQQKLSFTLNEPRIGLQDLADELFLLGRGFAAPDRHQVGIIRRWCASGDPCACRELARKPMCTANRFTPACIVLGGDLDSLVTHRRGLYPVSRTSISAFSATPARKSSNRVPSSPFPILNQFNERVARGSGSALACADPSAPSCVGTGLRSRYCEVPSPLGLPSAVCDTVRTTRYPT